MLDPVFLVTSILIVVATLLLLFFWNRLVGFLLSVVLRIAYWNEGGASIWIELGSLHLSLRAGRLLFKDVRYHSSSQTIKIVKGQISWRYWIRAPTLAEDLHAHAGGETADGRSSAAMTNCRIHTSVEGLEWFVYNRSAAYDAIVDQIAKKEPQPRRERSDSAGSQGRPFHPSSAGTETDPLYPPLARTQTIPLKLKTPRFVRRALARLRRQLPNLDPKSLLPVSFEGTKGAILCGNASTPSVLVAEFQRAEGIFGIVPARSEHDLYKQILNIRAEKASIRFAENDRYKSPMVATGASLHDAIAKTQPPSHRLSEHLSFSAFAKLWRHAKLKAFVFATVDAPKARGPGAAINAGSFRTRRRLAAPKAGAAAVDAAAGADADADVQYAVQRQICEAPVLELSYYADAVGLVPEDRGGRATAAAAAAEGCDVGNGGAPPEWGLDLVVHGGFLRYGPWADRQRAELQRAFFPAAYQDAREAVYLRPGESRVWTTLRVFVELRGGTTLYIPFREASKNWQWDGKVKCARPKEREAAYINVKAGDDSTISYLMPMVAGPEGYDPLLEVHLDTVVVSTSLNDIRLLRAESCRVQGNMPSPLQWKAERQWRFGVSLRQPVLYLLRDHINMLTDLSKDWTSGPPSNYFTWVPMRYAVDLDLRNYEINTYVNDQNIIDKPLIRDENALLTLRGAVLRNENLVPADRFRPPFATIAFTVDAPGVDVSLTLPRWNTHRVHAAEPITRLGRIGLLRLAASYLYFADVRPDSVEQLRLDFTAKDVVFKCLGWSIRHFMILRDNYFGSFTHFSTLNEYLEKLRSGIAVGDPIELKYRPGKSNMLQVELQLSVDNFLIVLPAGIPGYETYNPLPGQDPRDVCLGACAMVSVPDLQLQLRTHDYYMEMALNVGTVYGSVQTDCTERRLFEQPWARLAKEAFIVDGLDIVANRLFGPQPRTSTYVCIWEINVGDIRGMLSVQEVKILQAVFDAFGINYSDVINSPAAEYAVPVDPDVTFLKLTLESVDLVVSTGDAAVEASVPKGLCLERNDLAGNHYRKVTSVRVPEAQVRCLHRYAPRERWMEVAAVSLDASADVYSCPPGWRESAQAQRAFVAEQDVLTGRTEMLYPTQARQGRRPRHAGHSVYTGALQLPRPKRMARPDGHAKGRPPLPDSASQHPSELTRPTPFSHRQFASDSEGEDTYTETDRDLRLAHTRPSSLMPTVHTDDESMSSADESDDADLTMDSRSESEESDDCDEEGAGNSELRKYARLTRHYALQARGPSAWADSPFTLIKDYGASHVFQEIPEEASMERFVQWQADMDTPEKGDTTIVRLVSRSLDVWLTPLVPAVALQFLEENSRHFKSPELRMDSIMADHIRALASGPPSVPRTQEKTVIDAELSRIHVRVLQVTPVFEAEVDIARAVDDARPPISQELTVADVTVARWTLQGQKIQNDKRSETSVKTATEYISMTLGVGDQATLRRGILEQTLHPVCSLSLTGLEAIYTPKSAGCSWRDLLSTMEHSGPQRILRSLLPYRGPVFEVLETHKRLKGLHLHEAQLRVYQVLKWSSDRSVVDPLSTIQPLYLIQSGLPHELRVEPTFKVLFYLRNALRFLEVVEREAIRDLRPDHHAPVALSEVVELLHGQLTSLAADADGDGPGISSLKMFVRLFPTEVTRDAPPASSPTLEVVHVAFQSIKFSLLDPSQAPPCDATIGPLEFVASLRKAALLPPSPHKPTRDPVPSRDKPRVKLNHLMASLTLDSVEVFVLPHILHFAQRMIRIRKFIDDHGLYTNQYKKSQAAPTPSSKPVRNCQDVVYSDISVSFKRFRLQVAAENLIVVLGSSGLTIFSSAYLRKAQGRWDVSANSSLFLDSASIKARSSPEGQNPTARDALASAVVNGVKVNAVGRQEPFLSSTIRATLSVHDVRLSVPRSAIRLIRFVEEWRADYLPGIESMVHALLLEARKKPKAARTTRTTPRKLPTIQFQASLATLGVSLHIMPGTWLSWEIFNIVTYVRFTLTSTRKLSRFFGLRLASQRISISSVQSAETEPPTERVKLDLPWLAVTGQFEEDGVHAVASVGLFHVTVKPSYWDTLLSVQQKFGQDFNDLILIIGDARRKRPTSPLAKDSQSSVSMIHTISLKMKGFRLGLEGHSSTAFLDCEDISGGMSGDDGRLWYFTVTGLALSLASRLDNYAEHSTFTRTHRSAFVIIDFKVRVGHMQGNEKAFEIVVSKIHAVMQPSSIGEIGDFMDHLQAEVLLRQEERARELADFKEKTRSIMRTFEVKAETGSDGPSSWISDYAMTLIVKNIGAAFPLALERGLELPQRRTTDHAAVRAFLFSIRSLAFGAERSGKGQATMNGFSFQFVDQFRQSIPGDFSGQSHETRNRLIYPEMTAQIRTERSMNSRRIRIGANVSGFILDLDSTISDNIFSLVDVYRQGKERIERLASNIPRTTTTQEVLPKTVPGASQQYKSLPTSNVLLSLVFLSGKVRMYSGSSAKASRSKSFHDHTGGRLQDLGADMFNLPIVTVWGEYRATPALQKLSGAEEADPSSLMIKTTIHSSENTLRPSLLPFLSALINDIESRMRRASPLDASSASISQRDLTSNTLSQLRPSGPTESSSSMQITFALRIDQSQLQLTCQPDVNVIAGVHWDSGGFVLNISSGAHQVSLMGNVGGLTIGLKHGFLSEDCVRMDARNLGFSMTFSKADQNSGKTVSTVSLVVDTEVAGVVRFSRLQDVLCFKAVWLDRIPVYSGQATATAHPSSKVTHSHGAPSPKQELKTALLLRVRRIDVDVDLGQSISSIALKLEDVSVRSKLQETSSELSLAVGDLSMLAKGNVSGKAHIPDFSFRTIRRADIGRIDVPSTTKMLELSLTTGTLDLILESDYQKILQIWAEPFEISVFDDWSQISADIPAAERRLQLSFVVFGRDLVVAATVGTIPKLVSYAAKFKANLQAQREGATKESRAYSNAQSPKPDNPLSAVANAMLVSARTRLKEAENSFSYAILQQMKFHLNSLRLAGFPRTMFDVEMAHFVVHDVNARLKRVVETEDLPAKRELELSFSSITTSRFSQLNHAVLSNEVATDLRAWLDAVLKKVAEAIIFDLPSMHIFMRTDEVDDESAKTIMYDFISKFDRKKGLKDQEDIFITLNVSLYSWLTLLRKNLTREMDQVQSNTDWRLGSSSATPSPMASRKKTAETPPDLLLRDDTVSRPSTPPLSVRPLLLPSPVKGATKSASPVDQSEILEGSNDVNTLGPAIVLNAAHSKSRMSKSASPLPVSQTTSLTPQPGLSSTLTPTPGPSAKRSVIVYKARDRQIERLNMRQLGEATPDVMHPFFMKKAGFSLEDSLPQYVHEYATMPIDEITRALLKLYSKQLNAPE